MNITAFEENNGFTFRGLNDGQYTMEIRSVTLAGISDPTVVDDIFVLYTPGFFTWKVGGCAGYSSVIDFFR